MPNPTSSDRHVDTLAADHSIAFLQDQANAIYGNAIAVLPVKKRSDKYATFPVGTWNKRQAKRRAAGEAASVGGFTISTDTYNCDLYGLAHKTPREENGEAVDEVFDPEIEATEFATGQSLLEAEAALAAAIMAEGVWTTDLDGTTGAVTLGTNFLKWNEAASDPILDMVQSGILVQKQCGKRPNVGIVGIDVWAQLVAHPSIVDRMKHTSGESITQQIVAKLFELDKIIVPGLINNTAELGQTASMDWLVAADDVWLGYLAPSPGKRTLSAAYVYAFDADEFSQGVRVSKWYEAKENSDYVQVDLCIDVKVVAPQAGAFLNDVV